MISAASLMLPSAAGVPRARCEMVAPSHVHVTSDPSLGAAEPRREPLRRRTRAAARAPRRR